MLCTVHEYIYVACPREFRMLVEQRVHFLLLCRLPFASSWQRPKEKLPELPSSRWTRSVSGWSAHGTTKTVRSQWVRRRAGLNLLLFISSPLDISFADDVNVVDEEFIMTHVGRASGTKRIQISFIFLLLCVYYSSISRCSLKVLMSPTQIRLDFSLIVDYKDLILG